MNQVSDIFEDIQVTDLGCIQVALPLCRVWCGHKVVKVPSFLAAQLCLGPNAIQGNIED